MSAQSIQDEEKQSDVLGVIRERQAHIDARVIAIESQLQSVSDTVNQVKELLELPGNFWAWLSKVALRVHRTAKWLAPVIACLVAMDQFFHIDVWAAVRDAAKAVVRR